MGRHGGRVSGLRCLGLEQHENPGNVFSFVALGPSGVVAALTEPVIGWFGGFFGPLSPVTGFGRSSTTAAVPATALGGGGGIMNDDISSDVRTLARFSSGRPLACGGGGMVIVARNDSRSKFIRFVLFLKPWSSTESAVVKKKKKNT